MNKLVVDTRLEMDEDLVNALMVEVGANSLEELIGAVKGIYHAMVNEQIEPYAGKMRCTVNVKMENADGFKSETWTDPYVN